MDSIEKKIDEMSKKPDGKEKFPCPYSPDRKPFGSKQAKVNFDMNL